jgi:hypothetical protein
MRAGALTAIFFVSGYILATVGIGPASGQVRSSCSYRAAIPDAHVCSPNANPAPIPAGMNGGRMIGAGCTSAVIYAMASLYSYDDQSCHSANNNISSGFPNLKFVSDASSYFPSYYRALVSRDSNFGATLYCDTANNVLLLAFRGSLELTLLLNRNQRDDWIYTNILQHIGKLPTQYGFSQDIAELIDDRLRSGGFDGVCARGRPKLILTGHSKGGGQAQYAAARTSLQAIVFNSDIVNPVIYLSPFQQDSSIDHLMQSILGCKRARFDRELRVYSAYLSSGAVRDIRMVNDPLTELLYAACGDHLPHAPVEWLANTLSCPNDDGHSIRTVIRELRVCTGP